MTNTEYHAHPAVSKSNLDLIHKSPAHFRWAKDNPQDPTPAMRLGSLTHMAVLEPDRFASDCVVMPSMDRRTKAGKEAWEQFQADHPSHELLTSDEHTRIIQIRDAVYAHPMARKLLDQIDRVEASTFWTDKDTGLECKCRPDAILKNGLMIDLKTTQDAGPGFSRSVAKFRYHVQAAYYGDGMGGMEENAMVFIAVETTGPNLVACHMVSPDTLMAGRDAYRRNLETYLECFQSGNWPGYSTGINQIELPHWDIIEE